MRVEPDISAVADPNTGFLVGQTQTFPDGTAKYSEYRIGGTSLASPVIAGVQALAEQARGGVPIGFANPRIYDRYGTAAYHDVTDHPLGQGQGIADVRVDFANAIDASAGTITSLRTLGEDSVAARHRRLRRRDRCRVPRQGLRHLVQARQGGPALTASSVRGGRH